ncbi:unnamed protein product, partial [Coregonus sp. 'balchen']
MINKNAIAAQMNSLKKKEYVNGLENKVGSLLSENHVLKQAELGERHEIIFHDYALPSKHVKMEKETSGDVCLHVDKNHVSVEFCTNFLLGGDCSTMLDDWVTERPCLLGSM